MCRSLGVVYWTDGAVLTLTVLVERENIYSR